MTFGFLKLGGILSFKPKMVNLYHWGDIHVWFSIAFIVASLLHVYLNWSALTNYFKTKLKKGIAFRVEWITPKCPDQRLMGSQSVAPLKHQNPAKMPLPFCAVNRFEIRALAEEL